MTKKQKKEIKDFLMYLHLSVAAEKKRIECGMAYVPIGFGRQEPAV